MTGDLYVQSVLDQLPKGLALSEQIAMELRSHIAERREHGQPLEEILRQLGDPLTLAESYLAAVPMESARISSRIVAKLIDFVSVLAVVLLAAALVFAVIVWAGLPPEAAFFLPVICIVGVIFGIIIYTVLAEYRHGATIGKRVMGIRVVRESGARISLGQALLRQLPFLGQFFFIDALFALFTDRRQRAFEMLTKTRAVAILLFIVFLTPGISVAQPNRMDVGAQLLRLLDIGDRNARATSAAIDAPTAGVESVAAVKGVVAPRHEDRLLVLVRAAIAARLRQMAQQILRVAAAEPVTRALLPR